MLPSRNIWLKEPLQEVLIQISGTPDGMKTKYLNAQGGGRRETIR